MAENDNKLKPEQEEERDPFTNFMFGKNIFREEAVQSERESVNPERRSHWSDDWFFGNRRNVEQEAQSSSNEIEKILNQVDIELLMETIDMFVQTTKQLKPLLKEIRPFFSQLSKKVMSEKS